MSLYADFFFFFFFLHKDQRGRGWRGRAGCDKRDVKKGNGIAGKSTEGFEDVCERIKPAPSSSHCFALEQVQ